MIAVLKWIVCLIGLAAMAFVGFALFAVMYGIVLSFFGKNIYWEDLKDESNNRKV